ncbi:CCHC-type integrase [Fagus crenata]
MVSEQPHSTKSSILNSENSPSPITNPQSTTNVPLIALNIATQINEKLTPSTFPQWRAQFEALLIGYNLIDYVTGDNSCPSPNASSVSSLQKSHWVRQDKLILSAILASTSPTITPFISAATTSQEAWCKLKTMYASKSQNRSIQEYMHTVKALANEIAFINHPISEDDFTLYILNGLGPDFRGIVAPSELHDLLVSHESYLCRLEATTQQLITTANFSNRRSFPTSLGGSNGSKGFNKSSKGGPSKSDGSLAQTRYNGGPQDNKKPNKTNGQRRYQPKCQLSNCASTSKDTKWLIDSAASHNITGDLANLSVHSEYDGTDEVVIGDGSGSDHGGGSTQRCM